MPGWNGSNSGAPRPDPAWPGARGGLPPLAVPTGHPARAEWLGSQHPARRGVAPGRPAAAIDSLVSSLSLMPFRPAWIGSTYCLSPRQTGPIAAGAFQILDSVSSGSAADLGTHIGTDLATCPRCLSELFDPLNRRWRHPSFTAHNAVRATPWSEPCLSTAPTPVWPCLRCAGNASKSFMPPAAIASTTRPTAAPTAAPA